MISFEVAELTERTSGGRYLVLRVDTETRVDHGVEAIVHGIYWSRVSAEQMAASLNLMQRSLHDDA